MPTNILRKRNTATSAMDTRAKASAAASAKADGPRRVRITVGRVSFEAELLDTPTADRIWAALPLFSAAETWGAAIHFELPIESGREPRPTAQAKPGVLYFWSEEHRVILAFGETPISRPGEMRLPLPCSAWAKTSADLTGLAKVQPGQKVTLARLDDDYWAGSNTQ